MGFLGGEWHDQIHVLLIALERMNRLSGNKEGLQGAIARETETGTCLGTKCDSGIFQVSFSYPLWHGAGLSFPFPWRVVGSANIKSSSSWVSHDIKKTGHRTSLGVQWLRIHLVRQGIWVQPQVGELRHFGATKLACHNY